MYKYVTLHPHPFIAHQLAFLTPGILPASALIRNWYCDTQDQSKSRPMPARLQQSLLTRAILKSWKTPLPFPPIVHRFLICVGRV